MIVDSLTLKPVNETKCDEWEFQEVKSNYILYYIITLKLVMDNVKNVHLKVLVCLRRRRRI
jgi:hypothetical protein